MGTIAGAFANDRKFEHKQYHFYYAGLTCMALMPNRLLAERELEQSRY